MAGLWEQPSLEFGVKVVRVAGLDPTDQRQLEGGGALFVRYYVPAGDGKRRLRVDTREVPCGAGGAGDAFWGELARFERWSRGASVASGVARADGSKPGGGGLVFELRWRPRPSTSGLAAFLGTAKRRRPSRVLAQAELAWRDLTADAAAERWLTLSPTGRELVGCKAPKLLVEVNINMHAAVAGDEVKEKKLAGGVSACCSGGEFCGQCGWVGSEEDMFLATTFSQQQ